MILTLIDNGTCVWLIRYSVDWSSPTRYVWPIDIPDPYSEVTIYRATKDLDCCFYWWVHKLWGTITNPTHTFVAWQWDMSVEVEYGPCEEPEPTWDCVPSYHDIETLISKANCICERFEVTTFVIWDEDTTTLYSIIDTCNPVDPETTQTWSAFAEVMFVAQPDYLLDIVTALCNWDINWLHEGV
jgi:hypothetical protein